MKIKVPISRDDQQWGGKINKRIRGFKRIIARLKMDQNHFIAHLYVRKYRIAFFTVALMFDRKWYILFAWIGC